MDEGEREGEMGGVEGEGEGGEGRGGKSERERETKREGEKGGVVGGGGVMKKKREDVASLRAGSQAPNADYINALYNVKTVKHTHALIHKRQPFNSYIKATVPFRPIASFPPSRGRVGAEVNTV